ncbi:rhodanese-like domain-containing protein [Pseudoalteromonas tunicata]|jgi:rhodanese-related sulfurtransferase|uniref:Putative phage shock protein E n=2 Tax=Pseudoalteromonas tunicata TaxID=314281 RepID=A4CCE9_9GAMM|nr:rhodanese-like domain-containing protein [Pseudoalteromonas tunicata]ATC93747.1 phage shock protein E [Pseudoalteromonas tunicata]AXT29571.1 rhodanese-like domain-containing protein [Pseudoalteromonas tunicata]EAR27242.1 putative phage shock protein E [Pseudoalteromonas tunicata D2]
MKLTILSLTTVLFLCASPNVLAAPTPTVSQQTLIEAQKNNTVILLDVRSDEEFKDGHIPGAINYSHLDIINNTAVLDYQKDQAIIVYCRSGRRAAAAEQALIDLGFTNVKHLEGDWLGWQETQLKTDNTKAQ